MYDTLVTKVNTIDTKIQSTSKLITKTQYDLDKEGILIKLMMLTKR